MTSHTTSTTLNMLTVDRLLYVRIAMLVLYPARLNITHRLILVTVVNSGEMINYASPRGYFRRCRSKLPPPGPYRGTAPRVVVGPRYRLNVLGPSDARADAAGNLLERRRSEL